MTGFGATNGVLQRGERSKRSPHPRWRSGNANGFRASEVEHTVEGRDANGDLGGLRLIGVEAQRVAKDTFPARHLGPLQERRPPTGPSRFADCPGQVRCVLQPTSSTRRKNKKENVQ